MHPFSITLGIFVAGYITARWDLVTRLYELGIFAWDHGVVVRLPLVDDRGSKTNTYLPRLELPKASESSRFSSSSSSYLFNLSRRERLLCILDPLGTVFQPGSNYGEEVHFEPDNMRLWLLTVACYGSSGLWA